jgi:hypothetical protein
MKALTFTLLALMLTVGCEPNTTYKNHLETKPSTSVEAGKVYTISCEMPNGWVNFQTYRHPTNASMYRSGVWQFLTTDGRSVFASKCSAVIL